MAKAQKPVAAPENLPKDASPLERQAPLPDGPIADGYVQADTDYGPGLQEAQPLSGMAALDLGRTVIRNALATAPRGPGVYRMINLAGDVLYVGKAKNVRARLQNYANASGVAPRTLKMISLTAAVEFVTTHTEVEALLLESNLIKRLRPRFNILLRDDKSFPFIRITTDHDWAQISKHRGRRSRKGRYFGPFASAGAVNQTLNALQKAFPLRSCTDSMFAQRSRPCLQYQIKRCTAPCVGRISAADYADLLQQATDFLSGRSKAVQQRLAEAMQQAAEAMDYEQAATLRDRLRALAHVQSQQGINVASLTEADVIAAHQEGGQTCIQVFFFRSGQNWGNRAYFPSHGREAERVDVVAAFIGQFYDERPAPKQILLAEPLDNAPLLAEALSIKAEQKVQIITPQRGEKRALVQQAEVNAREALARRLAESSTQRRLLESLQDLLQLDSLPERIEVYDNSHIQGRNAVGAMIVAGLEGFDKKAYRKFNIKSDSLTPGDDYAMMREVLTRRFQRLVDADEDALTGGSEDSDAQPETAQETKKRLQNRRIAGSWPDLVIIDGGKGQLHIAQSVLADFDIQEVALIAISKGPDRNAGREQIHLGTRTIALEARSAVAYFLQRLRDEAHRYAIGTHRAARAKSVTKSQLDEIAGIGPTRKRRLLNHFGSVRAIEQAALADLEKVDGINKASAQQIFDYFHPEQSSPKPASEG